MRCRKAIRPTRSTLHLPSGVTGKPLAGLRICMGGFFSEQNLASCKHAGVKLVCIPQRGGKRTARREAYEKSTVFKDGQRFRAGIEGRISMLFRGRGMKRCLAEGRDRFEVWVAPPVLPNNLLKIAAMLTARSTRRQKAA